MNPRRDSPEGTWKWFMLQCSLPSSSLLTALTSPNTTLNSELQKTRKQSERYLILRVLLSCVVITSGSGGYLMAHA